MTKKRFLFLLTNEEEMEKASKFSEAVRKKLNDVDVIALYVKDVMKYEMFLNNMNGYGIQSPASMVVEEYREIETKVYEKIKKKAVEYFDKVYSKEGDTHEVLLEEMKAYDALVVVKSEDLTPAMKNLLRDHYKPLIILGDKKEYSIDKILMLNDGGYKVNKSIFAFFHLFGEQNIDVLRVNINETNRLTERFGNVCNVIDETGDDVYSTIMEYVPKYDMVIIGELRFTILFERLTGQTGIKIIENTDTTIFMG